LQILARRIIFDTDGEMVAYEAISPFVHLRSILQDLSTPGNGEGGSEQIREGASISEKPPTDNVERFFLCSGLIQQSEHLRLTISIPPHARE
jgi:hypothetical protein